MKMRKDYVFKAKFILMTDMGASIKCFKGASALVVPRIRIFLRWRDVMLCCCC